MIRVSTKQSHLIKWLLVAMFGLIVAWMWMGELDKPAPDYLAMSITTLICIGALAWVQWKAGHWQWADEVFDGGDHLLVRYGKEQGKVDFRSISRLEIAIADGATVFHVHLSVPLGSRKKISFLADTKDDGPIDSLIARINSVAVRVV